MNDLLTAKELLEKENHTCVLCKGESLYTSDKAGIAPMVEFISQGVDLKGYSAADKIIGKAAAMLFVLAGVKSVYGEVMSQSGADFLRDNGVEYSYTTLTEKIINRAGTDICPMEKTVKDITSPEEALTAIKNTIEQLRKGIHK